MLENSPFLSGRFFRGYYVALITRTMLFFLWLRLTARLNLRKEHTFFEPFPRMLAGVEQIFSMEEAAEGPESCEVMEIAGQDGEQCQHTKTGGTQIPGSPNLGCSRRLRSFGWRVNPHVGTAQHCPSMRNGPALHVRAGATARTRADPVARCRKRDGMHA